MYTTILGQKVKLGKAKIAPNNEAVSAYLAAAKKGQGLGKKLLKEMKAKKK